MPRAITQYRVFIASPGGLQEERERFRGLLEKYTKLNAEPRGVTFVPIGWEDTIGGAGRPQALINEDLSQCDYAVFVLHDRWGSPTGSGYSSGTEEEWKLAERLYEETKIRNIALFFKTAGSSQLPDPDQLKKVLQFKAEIEAGKKYLFKAFGTVDAFCDGLEAHLAKWLRDHEGATAVPASGTRGVGPPTPTAEAISSGSTPPESPGFDFWIAEANRLLNAESEPINYANVLFCAERALGSAGSDLEWAQAKNAIGISGFYLNNLTNSLTAFREIAERFASTGDKKPAIWAARALVNEGTTLGQLSRSEEAIAVYDDVVARFGTASEAALREQVARALFNKGVTLGELKRSEEAIAVYDDVVARFGTASEAALREQVARALFNKGGRLGELKRSEEAIAVYDDVVARFGTAHEPALIRLVEVANGHREQAKQAPIAKSSQKRRKKRGKS